MKEGLFLDTDVLADFLDPEGEDKPVLLSLLPVAACFTSVLQATELLASAVREQERTHVESLLGGLHVLGFHHKYCLVFGDLHRLHGARRALRTSMTAGMCILNKLPLVTYAPARYSAYPGLALFDASRLRGAQSWNDIQQATYRAA